MSDPKIAELKTSLVGIVSTIFLTDLLNRILIFNTCRSFVTGCGLNDKLMSLNALDILVFIPFSKEFLDLFIPQ